jgi:anti-anti-sigma regulatory factor
MLRITTQDDPRVVTLRVEGRLIGPWAAELEKCWRHSLACPGGTTLRVDLSGVTFIDAAGKAVIAAMHRQGAQLIAGDCMTAGLVEEIAKERSTT